MITIFVYNYVNGIRQLYTKHQYDENTSEDAIMNIIESVSWLGYEPEIG